MAPHELQFVHTNLRPPIKQLRHYAFFVSRNPWHPFAEPSLRNIFYVVDIQWNGRTVMLRWCIIKNLPIKAYWGLCIAPHFLNLLCCWGVQCGESYSLSAYTFSWCWRLFREAVPSVSAASGTPQFSGIIFWAVDMLLVNKFLSSDPKFHHSSVHCPPPQIWLESTLHFLTPPQIFLSISVSCWHGL